MKIFISLFSSSVSNVTNFNIDANDSDLIDSLSSLINAELNISNCEYEFVYNKLLCNSDKTLNELDIKENSKIYAIKKNLKPLKRQSDDKLNSLLNFGSVNKKLCTISNENYFEHVLWKNDGLNDIQSQMSNMITENPSLIEAFIQQPDVENLVNNPINISTLYAANPTISDAINNHPDKVKFFTDESQYVWIKNIMEDPKKYDNIMENYSENLKHAIDSKRFRRMTELFNSTADNTDTIQESAPTENEETVLVQEMEKFKSNVIHPILKSPLSNNIIDIIGTENHLSDSILKCCPYGSNLDESSLASIRNVMPSVINQWKQAIAHSSDSDKVLEYLQNNPIELDEDEARLLEETTDMCENREINEKPATNEPIILQLVQEITDRIECGKGVISVDGKSFDKELEVLNEMGFTDNIINLEAITKEHGNFDQAIYRLLV